MVDDPKADEYLNLSLAEIDRQMAALEWARQEKAKQAERAALKGLANEWIEVVEGFREAFRKLTDPKFDKLGVNVPDKFRFDPRELPRVTKSVREIAEQE